MSNVNKAKVKVFYACLVFLLGLGFAFNFLTNKPQVLPKETDFTFRTTLKSEPKIKGNSQLLIVGDSRIYAPLYPSFKYGDYLEISGSVDQGAKMYFPQIKRLKEGNVAVFNFRRKVAENFRKLIPSPESALVLGTVLGVDDLDSQFKDQLIKTGTIHVVVVSGQNMMIVAGIFLSFAKQLGRRNSLILAIIAVLFYSYLAGFELPVLRASIMVIAASLAIFFGKEVWPVWILLLAALLILFFNPRAISDVSYQLTFAASCGIMTLGKKLTDLFSRFPFLGQNVAIATSAFVFTSPVIFLQFGNLSLISPLANALVIESVPIIMFLGFLIAPISLVFMPLAQVIAFLVYVPAVYFVKVVEVLAGIS